VDYLRDPAAIYERSFVMIAAETDLSALDAGAQSVATRLVHACGMTDIVCDLAFSDDAVASGVAALSGGAPIICDARMVAEGIMRRLIVAGSPVHCAIGDDRTALRAEELGTTRSAAAMDLLGSRMDGAVVAIGNAPTALFHLLEGLDRGWPKPALILGFPVGFVGAVESKAELVANPRGVPFIALNGRRGGSAMAAAAVNALLIEAGGK